MHPDLQKYIDGELPREALSPALRADADAWDRLADAALDLHAEAAPAELTARVLAALPPASHGADSRGGAIGWMLRPRTVVMRPVYGLLAAAALAALLLLPRGPSTPVATTAPGGDVAAAGAASLDVSGDMTPGAVVYVRFVFNAPAAQSVALAGDFNDWETDALPLLDADGDGLWTGTFALQPGVHKYMFVVDGERWETDPGAERYMDDGFGMRNALIAIAAPVRRAI